MRSFSSNSFTQNLKIRGVIFDIAVLLGRGQDANINSLTQPTIVPKVSTSSVALDDIVGPKASNVQSKYTSKLRRKLGDDATLSSLRTDKPTDGQLLSKIKATPGLSDLSSKQSSRWLLASNMGDILDYIGGRTILLGILSKPEDSALTKQLQQQLTELTFLTAEEESGDTSKALKILEKNMKLLPREILITSSADAVLQTAKDIGYLTCRYRPLNASFGKVSCDFIANDPLGIQDAVESMNGIALRNSVFNSRLL